MMAKIGPAEADEILGHMSIFELAALPAGPTGRCPEVRQSWKYLEATHRSVVRLLESFTVVREIASQTKGSTRGRLSHGQVDLLRAALVFTSSGLDASCHRLIRDCAPPLIQAGGVAEIQFREYLKRELNQARPPSGLVEAVTAPNPREALVERYVIARTRASFQGSGDLKNRVRDLLGISNKTLAEARFTALDEFFVARNNIVHQLDYEDPASPTRSKRYHRAPAKVVEECDIVLALLADLILATANLLRPPQ
jgi:hypothetical protein